MRLILLIFISLPVLSSCVPNATTYYYPSADGGVVHAKRCVPTESLLDINIEGNHESIQIRTYAHEAKLFDFVYLGFSRGAWERINFTSTDFKIIDLENNSTISDLSVFTLKHDGFSKLNTEPYAASDVNYVQVRLPEPMPEKFELIVPSVIVDGDKIKIPAIRFERKLWVGISPFNC